MENSQKTHQQIYESNRSTDFFKGTPMRIGAARRMLKKLLSGVLLTAIIINGLPSLMQVKAAPISAPTPVLYYNFENQTGTTVTDSSGNSYNATLYGNATYATDSDTAQKALYLNGSSGTYMQFPSNFFNNVTGDSFTLSMKVKSETTATGGFFTFGVGNSTQYSGAYPLYYLFTRVDPNDVYYAITNKYYSGEQYAKVTTNANSGVWANITLVVTSTSITFYRDGQLLKTLAVTETMSSLGSASALVAYLGKSLYSADSYFNGYFDNLKIYNTALTADQVTAANDANDPFISGVTAPGCTILNSSISTARHTITLYVKNGTDLSNVPLAFTFASSSDYSVPASGTSVNLRAYPEITNPG